MQSGGLCCATRAILRKRTTPTRSFNFYVPNILSRRRFQSQASPSIPIENPLNPPELDPSSTPDQETAEALQNLSRRELKSIRVPPSRLLAEWLAENEEGHIVVIDHASDRSKVPVSDFLSLQNILLEYVSNMKRNRPDYFPQAVYDRSLPTFQRLGYTFDDLQKWSTILCVAPRRTPQLGWQLAANRYLQSEEETPFFILLIILRYDRISRWDVRALLLHTWYRFLGYSQRDIVPMISRHRTISMTENRASFSPAEWHAHPWKVPLASTPEFHRLEENAFMVLISRFLKQARRAFPEALPSIATMFGSYLWFTRGTLEPCSDGSVNVVDSKTHARLGILFNQAINKLSLPTVAYPARDMKHAWHAQRFLIELAGRFSPPLLLDQDSYRAIIRVLSASKKSHTELKFAGHMAPTWPPWREEQDGFDAERSIEDDLSRAVLATRRMEEAGFHLDYLDWEMLITGGRDSDGTPTVARRHTSTRRSGKVYGKHSPWVGRIRATRSAREAWMAFQAFEERRKAPITLPIYNAIFEKLVYERLRLLREQISEALPGESKEVIQHPFQNFSQDELARTEPMEEDMLYNHMIDSGLKPSGRFLDFLVRTAPSIATGVKYLQDGDLHRTALGMMLNYTAYQTKSPRILIKKMPYSTSDAFIRLLCRFTYGHAHTEKDYLPSKRNGKLEPPNVAGIQSFTTPLHYAIHLVRFYKPLFEPTWYSLFRALARPRVVIAASFSGHPQDDLLSWIVLKQILSEFHSCNLELGLTGFHSVCMCFEKAVFASWTPSDEYDPLPMDMIEPISENWKEEDLELIKGEWRRMTESVAMPFNVPRLLHSFYHAGIHVYVRVLGIARDWGEMVGVLEWMVAHKEELDEAARDYANGKRMRRKVFIAMRYFIEIALAELEPDGYMEEQTLQENSFNDEQEASVAAEPKAEMSEEQVLPEDYYYDPIMEEKTETQSEVQSEEPNSTEDTSRNDMETPMDIEGATRESLLGVEMKLRMLLEQEHLEHWGGWPLDDELRRYARITGIKRG